MAQISTIQPQFSSIEALWALFQAQSNAMRHAFIKRLLKEERAIVNEECNEITAVDEISRLDSLLYGSIHLPENFDCKKEIDAAVNSKYSI